MKNQHNRVTRKLTYNRYNCPDNFKRVLFHKGKTVVNILRQRKDLLYNYLDNPKKIDEAFSTFTHGYYYKDIGDNIVGFCIWKNDYDVLKHSGKDYRTMYIELLCFTPDDEKIHKMILFDLDSFAVIYKINDIQIDIIKRKKDLVFYKEQGYEYIEESPLYFFMVKTIIYVQVPCDQLEFRDDL